MYKKVIYPKFFNKYVCLRSGARNIKKKKLQKLTSFSRNRLTLILHKMQFIFIQMWIAHVLVSVKKFQINDATFGKKVRGMNNSFTNLVWAILIALKNKPEKWSRLLFYLLGTQKVAEVIQTGPTMIKPFIFDLNNSILFHVTIF